MCLGRKTSLMLGAVLLSGGLTACVAPQTRTDQGTYAGAAAGAAVGAILGQVIGGNTEGTVIGASVGGMIGGVAGRQVGAYMDRQENELRAISAQSAAMTVARVQAAEMDVLMATFKSDVLFDYNSAQLKPGAYGEIDRVISVLERYPQTSIRIEGHTDQSGSEEYNMRLSQRRADTVKNLLIQRGIQGARLQALGFGESMPISASAAQNRRVQIAIMADGRQV